MIIASVRNFLKKTKYDRKPVWQLGYRTNYYVMVLSFAFIFLRVNSSTVYVFPTGQLMVDSLTVVCVCVCVFVWLCERE